MTFKEAFAKARKEKGAGKTFTYKGKVYTTDYATESIRPKPRPSAPLTSPRPKDAALPRVKHAAQKLSTSADKLKKDTKKSNRISASDNLKNAPKQFVDTIKGLFRRRSR